MEEGALSMYDTRYAQLSSLPRSVRPLAGDGSTRRYERITMPGQPSMVAMLFDEPQTAFLRIHKILEPHVRVPLLYDTYEGMLLLEDLGNVSLLHEASRYSCEPLYEKALEIAASFQKVQADFSSFDTETFMREVAWTEMHFGALLMDERGFMGPFHALRAPMERLCEEIAAMPFVPVHRDYHAKNLMVHEGELVTIDFQDMRLGPACYDIVSLLYDSYFLLPDDMRNRLLQYAHSLGNYGSYESFLIQCDKVAIQRLWKAVGSFASFLMLRKKTAYLRHIGLACEMMRIIAHRQGLTQLHASLVEIVYGPVK